MALVRSPARGRRAHRLLRPGGAIAIVHLDWHPAPGSVVELTLELVKRHRTEPLAPETELSQHGMYPRWPVDLEGAGFGRNQLFGFDLDQVYGHAAWCGRMRASAPVSTMPPAAQAAFEADLVRALAMGYPDPTPVPHRLFALVARRR